MKQFLLYLSQVPVPINRNFLGSILLLTFFSINAQNAIVGSGFSNGWGGSCPVTGVGNFKDLFAGAGTSYGVTTVANGTGVQFFRFGVNWSTITVQLTKTIGSDDEVVPNTTYSLNTTCTSSGAMKYFVPSTSYNYVFKTLNAGTSPTGTFVFFEVQGAVRSVTAVEQSPLAANVILCSPINVTATLDGALSPGQAVYMRYTKDNSYTNSTVVQLTGSGTTYTGTIPSAFNTAIAGVSYYVFTSGTTAPSGADADLYTINLNNNGGSNYSYTVGGATTAIPDPNFEQALIDLNLDCAIDGKVLTSNISGVTTLDLKDKNIISLIGIKAFTNLTTLQCGNLDLVVGNDNAITDLDVSVMSQLKFLYCENNKITNLNISGLTNLWELITSNNPLSSSTLDVHGSPDLYYLFCESNGLTSLNITGLTKLQVFGMRENSIQTLDLSNNLDLNYLDCDYNAFTSINVSGLTKLNEFYCISNLLTSLNVRGLTSLDYFDCTNNLLTCILVDDVAAANTAAATEILPSTVPKSYNWAKDSGASYSYCDCSTTTTWSVGSWNNGPPTSTSLAVILGD
jgi:Leucine-rich repeat (LRR) protein